MGGRDETKPRGSCGTQKLPLNGPTCYHAPSGTLTRMAASTHTHTRSLPTNLSSLPHDLPSLSKPPLQPNVPAQQSKGQLRLVHHRGTHVLRAPHAPVPFPGLGRVRCQIERRMLGLRGCCFFYCCCCGFGDFSGRVLRGRVGGRHGCVL